MINKKTLALSVILSLAAGLPAAAATSSVTTRPDLSGARNPAGAVLWFNSVMRPTGVPRDRAVTICVRHQVVTVRHGWQTEVVELPDAVISFKPWENQSSTYSYGDQWNTSVPSAHVSRDTFMSGGAHPLQHGLASPVPTITWTARFESDADGVAVQWQSGAAAYTHFNDDDNTLDVAVIDTRTEPAGTPRALKGFAASAGRTTDENRYTGTRSTIVKVPAERSSTCGGAY